MIVGVLVIVAHYQNTTALRFRVPMVPFLPALSIFCNIEFMVHLNILTWIRFFVWMIIGKIYIFLKTVINMLMFTVINIVSTGMMVYFLYGIHHSKEGDNISTYSMLMTSSEAVKGKWGATTKSNIKAVLTQRKSSNEERSAIIDEEEIVQ